MAENNGKEPQLSILTCMLKFSEPEQVFYELLYSRAKKKFLSCLSEGSMSSNMSNILGLLLHLRLASCHPALVVQSFHKQKKKREGLKRTLSRYLYENGNMYTHIVPFLKDVLEDVKAEENLSHPHPTETQNTNKRGQRTTNPRKMDSTNWKSSVKIDEMIKYLDRIRRDDGSKSVVISQFTSMLDLVEIALKREKIQYVRIDGSTSRNEREIAIQTFQEDPQTELLIMSLRCGGLGLNLACANNALLLDLAWNPLVEEHMISRVCNNKNPETVTHAIRFMVEGSVEEKMLELRKEKKGQEETILSKQEMMKKRVEDMKIIFD